LIGGLDGVDWLVGCLEQDTLRGDCDSSVDCVRNCCVNAVVAPVYFVVFVLVSQFVLVNVVVAVLMKHLEVNHPLTVSSSSRRVTCSLALLFSRISF